MFQCKQSGLDAILIEEYFDGEMMMGSMVVVAYLKSDWVLHSKRSDMNRILYANNVTILKTWGSMCTKFKVMGWLSDIQKSTSVGSLGLTIAKFRKPFPWESK